MTATPHVQRIAESLIRHSCRRLPAEVRAERCREWSAELPAILADESVRPRLIRAVRLLSFSAGIATATRRLGRAGRTRRAPAPEWRDGAIRHRPDNLAVRAVFGLISWLVIVFGTVSLLRAFPHPHSWVVITGLVLAAGFALCCVADVVRAPAVRYLPKWAWALICCAQIPSGGILYLSVGRVGRAGSMPPGSASQP
jgi:hypothetical protein